MEKVDLSVIREEIDGIDMEIVSLLEKRLDLSLDVAAYKQEKDLPIFDQEREKEVIKRCLSYLSNDKYACIIERIYTEIMNGSKDVQRKLIQSK